MTESSPGRIIGRYALFDILAAGGMATVHIGRLLGPVGFARTVAIKRLHPQFSRDPEFVAMFLDEARVCARIRHPNVVPTLDVVATQGELFLVMEYVQGEALSQLIRKLDKNKQLIPPRHAIAILAGVLHGLHAAHEAKDERGLSLELVHRDVSPQNVLIGTDGLARVLDFGIAKAAGRLQTTREGAVKGKLAYMAPEQVSGSQVSRQADIYAAAVVLWETLTCRRLFEGDSEAVVLARVLTGEITPPSKWAPEVSAELDALVMRNLSKDPADRCQSARAFAQELEKLSPSPIGEVGEWVEALAQHSLEERAQVVLAVEQGSGHLTPVATELPSPRPPPPPPPTTSAQSGSIRPTALSEANLEQSGLPRKRPLWQWALPVAGAVSLGAVVMALLAGSEAPANATPSSQAVLPPVQPTSEPRPAATESAVVEVSAVSVPSAQPLASTTSAAQNPFTATTAAAAPAPVRTAPPPVAKPVTTNVFDLGGRRN